MPAPPFAMSRTWQAKTPRSSSKKSSAFFEIDVRAMALGDDELTGR